MAQTLTILVRSTDSKISESARGPVLRIGLQVELSIPDLLAELTSMTEKQTHREPPPEEVTPWDTLTESQLRQNRCHIITDEDPTFGRWTSSKNGWELLDEEALRLVKINRLERRPLIKKVAPTPETSAEAAQRAEFAYREAKDKVIGLKELTTRSAIEPSAALSSTDVPPIRPPTPERKDERCIQHQQ